LASEQGFYIPILDEKEKNHKIVSQYSREIKKILGRRTCSYQKLALAMSKGIDVSGF